MRTREISRAKGETYRNDTGKTAVHTMREILVLRKFTLRVTQRIFAKFQATVEFLTDLSKQMSGK